MARHRNIRQLGLDDILTYDEPLASSVDDDYGISPALAEMYMHKASRSDASYYSLHSSIQPIEFTADDFPVNESTLVDVDDISPGPVSGRIRSQGNNLNGSIGMEVHTDPLEMVLNELTIGGAHENHAPDHAFNPPTKTSVPSVGLPQAASSQSLRSMSSTNKEGAASFTRVTVAASSVTASPSKPIDRKPLLQGYNANRSERREKEIINLIVVGHVDAGKSTLMGNLLCRLGLVSGKQLSKYRWEAQKLGKSSFAYAWVLDQTEEERNRGVTMDIAQTSFETKTKRVALMDAPGHKDFVPRVIGGASQADAALLVINATNGEFETGFGSGGQTREHARLLRLLGVSRLIVVVNKMDTVNWESSRFESIRSQLTSFFKSLNLSAVSFCPVSGLAGVNLTDQGRSNSETKANDPPDSSKLFEWYKGPCLLDLIDEIPPPDRTVDGPFRFVVTDVFKPVGLGVPAVAGRVLSGAVSAGVNLATSKVFCQPSGLPATVKSIRSLCSVRTGSEPSDADASGGLLDQTTKYAFAGDQVALVLNGIDPCQCLVPGDLITDPDNPVPLASRIQAKILVFGAQQPITRGYPVIFYYHCTSLTANVSKLKSMVYRENKVEKTLKKPRCLFGNCTADIELTFDRPVCLEVYDKCKALGRFMLRVGGESVAGGTVTAVLPSKKNQSLDK